MGDERKLCKDCAYCRPAETQFDEDKYTLATCVRAPKRNDLVAGGKVHPFCDTERHNISGCGPSGRNFKQQP